MIRSIFILLCGIVMMAFVYSAHGAVITIEAEDYDQGGEGVAYHDETEKNSGNTELRPDEGVDLWDIGDGTIKIGSVRTDEWVNYTSTYEVAGVYEFTFYLSTPNDNGSIEIYLNETKMVSFVATNTGDYKTFVEHVHRIEVPEGENTIKVLFTGDSLDMDKITIEHIEVFERKVRFSWDADNTPNDCNDSDETCFNRWEKINFYERTEEGIYGEVPFYVSEQSYTDDGLSTPTFAETVVKYEMYKKTKKYFILRSAIGNLESVDSDEVFLEVDLTRPASATLSVEYSQADDVVSFTWEVDEDERVDRFSLQVSDTESEYTNLKIIKKEEITENKITIPRSEIFEKNNTTKHFTIVSITSEVNGNVYSNWAPDVELTYSVKEISRPEGLTIK